MRERQLKDPSDMSGAELREEYEALDKFLGSIESIIPKVYYIIFARYNDVKNEIFERIGA